ncbi:hypothetical protein [Pseudomaricurvus sp. HS19]|uniref:hypothetical protein n=1 Tax=Pseudomaricurvus sp. HS19 TaxID=2692626 RepID=UPI0013717765|nr:hypothetical protein [Pseudomaricurvus sp. HS19]MYM64463.1 hypothetical protein [Pseudomaricurvus sp. HS19]
MQTTLKNYPLPLVHPGQISSCHPGGIKPVNENDAHNIAASRNTACHARAIGFFYGLNLKNLTPAYVYESFRKHLFLQPANAAGMIQADLSVATLC